jgi:hypothetical protein
MARIKTVEVGFTYNMGNYESLRLSLSAELNIEEANVSVRDVVDQLKATIDREAARLKNGRR